MTGSKPRWLSRQQQAELLAYIVGTTLLVDTLDRELRQNHGLSMSEYEILVRLSECPDRTMRMAEIAEAMRHSRSRVTHTVSRMESAGLVVRSASSDDRRGVNATMTESGYALLVEAAPTHVKGVREHFVDLATPEDFTALGRVMNSVADHLIGGDEAFPDIRKG